MNAGVITNDTYNFEMDNRKKKKMNPTNTADENLFLTNLK